MVVVVPKQVEWTEACSVSFTTAIRDANMPRAYGFLRYDEGRWNLLINVNNFPYGDKELRGVQLIDMLNKVPSDIVVLMEHGDFVIFQQQIQPHLSLDIVKPECLYDPVVCR
jgi:hypothetical protein